MTVDFDPFILKFEIPALKLGLLRPIYGSAIIGGNMIGCTIYFNQFVHLLCNALLLD